jgi:hypothetical protein
MMAALFKFILPFYLTQKRKNAEKKIAPRWSSRSRLGEASGAAWVSVSLEQAEA